MPQLESADDVEQNDPHMSIKREVLTRVKAANLIKSIINRSLRVERKKLGVKSFGETIPGHLNQCKFGRTDTLDTEASALELTAVF